MPSKEKSLKQSFQKFYRLQENGWNPFSLRSSIAKTTWLGLVKRGRSMFNLVMSSGPPLFLWVVMHKHLAKVGLRINGMFWEAYGHMMDNCTDLYRAFLSVNSCRRCPQPIITSPWHDQIAKSRVVFHIRRDLQYPWKHHIVYHKLQPPSVSVAYPNVPDDEPAVTCKWTSKTKKANHTDEVIPTLNR